MNRNLKATIAFILVLCMILTLAGCGKEEEVKEPVQNVVSTNIDSGNPDIQKAILETSDSNLKAFIEEVPGIVNNLDTVYEYTEYTSLIDSGVYEANRNYNIECKPSDSNTVVHDDFMLNAHIEYKGDDKFPSSINVTYTFTDSNDHKVACTWAYDIIRAIINKDAGDKLEITAFGDTTALTDVEDRYSIVCNKELIDETQVSGNYKATFTVICVDSENEFSYSDINNFKTILGSEFGIYKTGLMNSDFTANACEEKISSYFKSENIKSTIKILSNYHHETNNVITEEAFFAMSIVETDADEQQIQSDLTCRVKTVYNKETESYDTENLDIQFVGFERDTKEEALGDIEDFLAGLYGKHIDLKSHIKEEKFSVPLESSENGNKFGLPAEANIEVVDTTEVIYCILYVNTVGETEATI